MGAFNNPNEILLDCEIDPMLENVDKIQFESIKGEIPQSSHEVHPETNRSDYRKSEAANSQVDEKGEFQIMTDESSQMQKMSSAKIREPNDSEPLNGESEEDIMQKKQEELQGQLNLTLISEEG